MLGILLLLLLLSVEPVPAPPAPLPATVTLASHGKAVATIVISPDAPPGVQQAAQELAQYAARMAGCAAPLAVRALGEPPADPEPAYAFVGAVEWALRETGFDAASMPEEGYAVFAHNSSWLFVVGRNDTTDGLLQMGSDKPTGFNDTLSATYGLLGELGVRWLWPGASGEVVPSVPAVSAPPAGDGISSAPPLIQRHLRPIYNARELPIWQAASHNAAADAALSSWFNASVFDTLAAEERRWLQRMHADGRTPGPALGAGLHDLVGRVQPHPPGVLRAPARRQARAGGCVRAG